MEMDVMILVLFLEVCVVSLKGVLVDQSGTSSAPRTQLPGKSGHDGL